MKVLGIDPGTITTGFGIVTFKENKFTYESSGIIKTTPNAPIQNKLQTIYDNIVLQIKEHKPEQFAIETAFYGKNVQSTLKIGYARGVALLAASHFALPVCEYSPREIKNSITGNGNAGKEQVAYMIASLLDRIFEKSKLDETDALAVACCHAFRHNSVMPSGKSNWKDFIKDNPDRIIE